MGNKVIVTNNESNDKNDWRYIGQDDYLMSVSLQFSPYTRWSETWDHDHCTFCTDGFSEYEGDLHEGYCTLDKKHWICEKCFNDFKDMFKWQVVN